MLAGCQSRRRCAPSAPNRRVAATMSTRPRHKVALIIPLSGEDGGVGTSIANAANLALLDSGNRSIRAGDL